MSAAFDFDIYHQNQLQKRRTRVSAPHTSYFFSSGFKSSAAEFMQ
jgi:hypothetical protein